MRTCTLLRLDKASSTVNADGQAARDLGVERARVTRLLDSQDASDPCDDLVRGRVRGLVEVDHTSSAGELVSVSLRSCLLYCSSVTHLM